MSRLNRKLIEYLRWYSKKVKQLNFTKFLKEEVEIGANGTQRYKIKEGKNRGKVL